MRSMELETGWILQQQVNRGGTVIVFDAGATRRRNELNLEEIPDLAQIHQLKCTLRTLVILASQHRAKQLGKHSNLGQARKTDFIVQRPLIRSENLNSAKPWNRSRSYPWQISKHSIRCWGSRRNCTRGRTSGRCHEWAWWVHHHWPRGGTLGSRPPRRLTAGRLATGRRRCANRYSSIAHDAWTQTKRCRGSSSKRSKGTTSTPLYNSDVTPVAHWKKVPEPIRSPHHQVWVQPWSAHRCAGNLWRTWWTLLVVKYHWQRDLFPGLCVSESRWRTAYVFQMSPKVHGTLGVMGRLAADRYYRPWTS